MKCYVTEMSVFPIPMIHWSLVSSNIWYKFTFGAMQKYFRPDRNLVLWVFARENMFMVKEIFLPNSGILLCSTYIYRNVTGEVFPLNILHVVTEREEVSTRLFLFSFADMDSTVGVLTLYLIKKPALRNPHRGEAEHTRSVAGTASPSSSLTSLSHYLHLVLLLGNFEFLKKILYSSRAMTCCLKWLPCPFLIFAEIRT